MLVPFEYNAIAKRWEYIRVEDLKIERDELIVVNYMYRLRNLPDDSVVLNSPRNIVLKLIKRINPDHFIHGVVNGAGEDCKTRSIQAVAVQEPESWVQAASLDQKILSRARTVMKSDYHKDFAIEVDGQWMLQGWKGRVIRALSCWKPVQE
ncbi:hypothetical protein CRYUN_Cryun11dG0129800 [Craigia yunnanensis]